MLLFIKVAKTLKTFLGQLYVICMFKWHEPVGQDMHEYQYNIY